MSFFVMLAKLLLLIVNATAGASTFLFMTATHPWLGVFGLISSAISMWAFKFVGHDGT